jgi:hypothetical protein
MRVVSTCSKTIAYGCAIAFVISGLMALILINLQSHFLNPDTYTSILDEQAIYDRLPAILADQIAYSMTYNPCNENPEQCEDENPGSVEDSGPPAYLKNLSKEDWEQMLSLILTPEWTKSQVESSLDQFFHFIESNHEKLAITISLAGLKANLTGQKGMEFIRILIEAQPPCTETLLGILLDAAAGDFTPDQLLLCQPPKEILDRLTPTMQAALDLVIDDIPDQAILGNKVCGGGKAGSDSDSSEAPVISFRTIRTLIRFSFLLPLLFLSLLTLFAVRSLRDFLIWWGIPFIILGLSALGMGLFAFPLLDWGLETFVLGRLPGAIHPDTIELITESVKLLMHSFVQVIANQAALIAFLGLSLTGVGLLTIYQSEKKSAM